MNTIPGVCAVNTVEYQEVFLATPGCHHLQHQRAAVLGLMYYCHDRKLNFIYFQFFKIPFLKSNHTKTIKPSKLRKAPGKEKLQTMNTILCNYPNIFFLSSLKPSKSSKIHL